MQKGMGRIWADIETIARISDGVVAQVLEGMSNIIAWMQKFPWGNLFPVWYSCQAIDPCSPCPPLKPNTNISPNFSSARRPWTSRTLGDFAQ